MSGITPSQMNGIPVSHEQDAAISGLLDQIVQRLIIDVM